MASITPRISGLWADGYFDDAMGNEEDIERREQDARTPLDRTIDRIGMGSYQWTLLALCGFGWLADNMWIQTVAIILPRVQQHFEVSDSHIGYLSSAMFAGMMLGAVGWGSCSDLLGRSTAFNLTLFFTAVFGLLSSYAPSFLTLCVALFLLGTSVGGSMPTDGTLLLEHMPRGKQYLVTALSVFFSFGSVLSAVVGILVIPNNSCPAQTDADAIPCDVATMNLGWKYLLMAVGFITLSFFVARIVFFRLHESPRYLVHAGRPEEALVNLQKISKFNGSELELALEDVQDHPIVVDAARDGEDDDIGEEHTPFIASAARKARTDVRILFDAGAEAPDGLSPGETEPLSDGHGSASGSRTNSRSSERAKYDATGSSEVQLDSHKFATPARESMPHPFPNTYTNVDPTRLSLTSHISPPLSPEPKITTPPKSPARPRFQRGSAAISSPSRRSSFYEAKARVCWALPRWIRRPLWAWLDKVSLVLSPDWRRTTLLVWAMWCSMSLAYTMFNVFLPKMLEMQVDSAAAEGHKSLDDTMWDVVIFTLGGCPGALLGAYMVESRLGRRWSLASSTFITAVFCLLFIFSSSSLAVRFSTIGISLSSTTMWSVLYGWTPEIFDTAVRGTACGTASALSRIGGMIAPVLGGLLLMVSRSLPVYFSIVIFTLAGVCTLMLHAEERGRPVEGVFAH